MAGRFGPNVLISLALLVLDLGAFFILVSSKRNVASMAPAKYAWAFLPGRVTIRSCQRQGLTRTFCSWVQPQLCSTTARPLRHS